MPRSRPVVDAVPRPRLFAVLDRQASVTVVQAPPGFGKRTLVASWLHSGGAAQREVVWIDEEAEAAPDRRVERAATEFADERPCVLVVAGVAPRRAAAVLATVVGLLDRNPEAIAVVTVHGTVELPSTAPWGGVHVRRIGAREMCFTAAETADLCRERGMELSEERSAQLCRAVAGVPPLVAAAARGAAAPIDATGAPSPALIALVEEYVTTRLARVDDAVRRAAETVVPARAYTEAEAEAMTGLGGAGALLDRLEAAGLLPGDHDGSQRRWVWPPAVRQVLMQWVRRHDDAGLDRALTRLGRECFAAGRYAEAAEYAVDAGDWDVAVRIIDEHWSRLVADHFETLVHLLRAIPDEVAAHHPGVAAGKALFIHTLTGHPLLQITLPTTADALARLGADPTAAEVLHVGSVQAIALRMAGSLREGSDRAATLVPLVESMLAHQPAQVTAQLPTLRLQWAIGMQLAGDLGEATAQFEQAHRDAQTAGFEFVVLNAAGSLALNWALLGDLPRTEHWLAAEARVDTSVGYWDEMIRVGGRVATVLAHLDRLDTTAAAPVLELLGIPAPGEELWGLVAYTRAQYALTTGDPYTGLTEMHRIIDGHRSRYQPGSLPHVLLTATEIDLHLALGHGNRARALAESDATGHPMIVVAAARTELLTGHPDTARTVLTRIPWPHCRWLRAHVEALAIDAAACVSTDPDHAVDSWRRAHTVAESVGITRALATIPAPHQRQLHHLAFPDAAPSRPVRALFPDTVAEVTLTDRERALLLQLDRGIARRDLAETLWVSPNTVKTQLRSICRKLDAPNSAAALARARELHLLR